MRLLSVRRESSDSVRILYNDAEAISKAVSDYARSLRLAHPEIASIRWFGSRVRGDATVGSDVDLCIIVRESSRPRRERVEDYLPRSFPVGLDLYVPTIAERAKLGAEHPSMSRAIENGREV